MFTLWIFLPKSLLHTVASVNDTALHNTLVRTVFAWNKKVSLEKSHQKWWHAMSLLEKKRFMSCSQHDILDFQVIQPHSPPLPAGCTQLCLQGIK